MTLHLSLDPAHQPRSEERVVLCGLVENAPLLGENDLEMFESEDEKIRLLVEQWEISLEILDQIRQPQGPDWARITEERQLGGTGF